MRSARAPGMLQCIPKPIDIFVGGAVHVDVDGSDGHRGVSAQPWARHLVVKALFPWVASRASMLFFSGAYSYRAVVCLHAAHIEALLEFWTDWLPTETPFLHDHKTCWEPRLNPTIGKLSDTYGAPLSPLTRTHTVPLSPLTP